MNTITQTLDSRGNSHGNYIDLARYSQAIKEIVRGADDDRVRRGQTPLSDAQHEALDLMATKIGRILAGDPGAVDHWHDLAGYATLVEKQLNNVTAQEGMKSA